MNKIERETLICFNQFLNKPFYSKTFINLVFFSFIFLPEIMPEIMPEIFFFNMYSMVNQFSLKDTEKNGKFPLFPILFNPLRPHIQYMSIVDMGKFHLLSVLRTPG